MDTTDEHISPLQLVEIPELFKNAMAYAIQQNDAKDKQQTHKMICGFFDLVFKTMTITIDNQLLILNEFFQTGIHLNTLKKVSNEFVIYFYIFDLICEFSIGYVTAANYQYFNEHIKDQLNTTNFATMNNFFETIDIINIEIPKIHDQLVKNTLQTIVNTQISSMQDSNLYNNHLVNQTEAIDSDIINMYLQTAGVVF